MVRLHTLVTFRFGVVTDIELSYFARQNAIAELELEQLEDGGPPLQVQIWSSVGLEMSLRCETATVLRVEESDPGPHSVYGGRR